MPNRTALICSVILGVATTLPVDRAAAQGAAGYSRNSQSTMAMDSQVLSKIHHINQTEIQLGKLAQEKAASARVKSYGERLMRDHETADRQVTALAKRLNVQLITPQPNTRDETQKMKMEKQTADKLRSLSGKDFDSMFLEAMAQDHQDAIAMLMNVEGEVSPPVRDLVINLLPTLHQHERMAVELQRSVT